MTHCSKQGRLGISVIALCAFVGVSDHQAWGAGDGQQPSIALPPEVQLQGVPPPASVVVTDPVTGERKLVPVAQINPTTAPVPNQAPPGMAIITDPVTGERKLAPVAQMNPNAATGTVPNQAPPGMAIITDPATGERKLVPVLKVQPQKPLGSFPSTLELQRPAP